MKGRRGQAKASGVDVEGFVCVNGFRSTLLGGCCHGEAGGRLTGREAFYMVCIKGTFGFSSWSSVETRGGNGKGETWQSTGSPRGAGEDARWQVPTIPVAYSLYVYSVSQLGGWVPGLAF